MPKKEPYNQNQKIFLSMLSKVQKRNTKQNKASAYTASFTIEAAFVFPIVVTVFAWAVFFFQVLMIQIEVEKALQYAVRETAVYICTAEVDSRKEGNELRSILAAQGIIRGAMHKQLSKSRVQISTIRGGELGIRYWIDRQKTGYLYVRADYTILFPIHILPLPNIRSQNVVCARRWCGDREEKGATEESVYVTPTGTAYHYNRNCPYLDLSIQETSYIKALQMRNHMGGKYKACRECARRKVKDQQKVWITDYGDRYHLDPGCSGLKRTIYRIPIREVGDRHPCKKCGGRE